MKSKSKFEIAQAADISTEVLRLWIMERRKEISALAVKIFKYKWKSRATLTGGPAKHQLTKHFSTMRKFYLPFAVPNVRTSVVLATELNAVC